MADAGAGRIKIVKRTPEEIAAAQAKREQEMREREAQRKKEEDEKLARIKAEQEEKHKKRLEAERAEIERRAEERRLKDAAGESLQEEDFRAKAEKERLAAERKRQAELRALSGPATSTRAAPKSSAETQAALENAPKQMCIWGCKCPGYVELEGSAKSGPAMCSSCKHTKSQHAK